MRHIRWPLFFFLCWNCVLLADVPKQKNEAPLITDSTITDTAAIHLRSFDEQAMDKYRQDRVFQYEEELSATASLWERFWNWFWSLFRGYSEQSRPSESSPFFRYVVFGLAVISLILIIIRLLGKDMANIFSKEAKSAEIPYTESLENIHEITFDEDIEQALQVQNYKLAVRLLYLRVLKQLNDAQLIHWKIDKTNAAYLQELKNREHQVAFRLLTQQFEYIWYGNFPVNQQVYQHIQQQFTEFNKTLS